MKFNKNRYLKNPIILIQSKVDVFINYIKHILKKQAKIKLGKHMKND